MDGERSGLFYEALRIIKEINPPWIVWENVPGLLSSDKGRDLARVLFSLVENGYSGCYRLLDSRWFGVAQQRRRVFGVFSRHCSGAERAAKVLSIVSGGKRIPKPGGGEGGETTKDGSSGVKEGCSEEGVVVFQYQASRTQGLSIRKNICPTLDCSKVPCFVMGGLNSNSEIKKNVSATLICNKGHAVYFEEGSPPRRLTPLEYERLQGFPDNFTSCLSDTQRYKALGNAVTVNVAEWVAGRLMDEILSDYYKEPHGA